MKTDPLVILQKARDYFWQRAFDQEGKLRCNIQLIAVAADMLCRAEGTMTYWYPELDEDGKVVYRDPLAEKGADTLFQKYCYLFPYRPDSRLYWPEANERQRWEKSVKRIAPGLKGAFYRLRRYVYKEYKLYIYMVGADVGKCGKVAITINPLHIVDAEAQVPLTVRHIEAENRQKRTRSEIKIDVEASLPLGKPMKKNADRLARFTLLQPKLIADDESNHENSN